MRGKVPSGALLMAAIRITPAYAGKSLRRSQKLLQARDHPRVCGEKNPDTCESYVQEGSPPRMRGKDGTGYKLVQIVGITPAYAGKSAFRYLESRRRWDHPRVCGEKGGPHRAGHPPRGSPPRMRGKATYLRAAQLIVRITPAYAGKRKDSTPTRHTAKDHPRVCGEKPQRRNWCNTHQGSPPRMRGKAHQRHHQKVCAGITPAYAGKSSRDPRKLPLFGDHPRVCGEKGR